MEVLLCPESSSTSEGPVPSADPSILNDPRVLENLISLQLTTMPVQNYFRHIQSEIEPYMRKVVTTWMLEVCEEQGCDDQVFNVAVNFLDRFLCTSVLKKTQLQLVGAVCLLVASKLRQCRSLSAELLSYYTDHSVTQDEIKKWELLLLSKLSWDLSPVTPTDFLELIVQRLPDVTTKNHLVKRHAATFIALAATESDFLMIEPSVISVGAVLAAIRGLYPSAWRRTLSTLATLIKVEPFALEQVVQLVESTVQRESAMLPETHSQHLGDTQTQTHLQLQPTKYQQQPMDCYDGNETPTDVAEIHF